MHLSIARLRRMVKQPLHIESGIGNSPCTAVSRGHALPAAAAGGAVGTSVARSAAANIGGGRRWSEEERVHAFSTEHGGTLAAILTGGG
jgi:hypothetical protein